MTADREMREFLRGTVGVVEATSFEKLCLWQEYQADKISWQDQSSGLHETIGFVDSRPVCLSLFTAEIDGHKILFIEPTSQVVDHQLIDKWLSKTLPASAKRDGTEYINRVNAMNFHNVFRPRTWKRLAG